MASYQKSIVSNKVCYVCDAKIVGRFYGLANCRTQTTKTRVTEKLSQLVGEDYMVILSEEDMICRCCANMVNSLDRLEKELLSLRSIILRYLEKKYVLQEGELVNRRSYLYSSSMSKGRFLPKGQRHEYQVDSDSESKSERIPSFQIRKRKLIPENDAPDSDWVTCDRCHFTAMKTPANDEKNKPPNSVKVVEGINLVEDDQNAMNGVKSDQISASKIVSTVNQQSAISNPDTPPLQAQALQVSTSSPAAIQVHSPLNSSSTLQVTSALQVQPAMQIETPLHVPTSLQIPTSLQTVSTPSPTLSATTSLHPETVEPVMMTAEIVGDRSPKSIVESTSTSEAASVTGLEVVNTASAVTLQAIETEDGTNTLCMVDENGIIVQKVEQAEDGTLYVQMADSADTTNKMLSVGEDGSIQMVEVLWDEMVSADDGTTMVTF